MAIEMTKPIPMLRIFDVAKAKEFYARDQQYTVNGTEVVVVDSISGRPQPGPWLMIAERYANRAARALMATAGPLFWMALVFIAVAASLGWRLLFF